MALIPYPLLDVNVSNQSESGMLGIASARKMRVKEVPHPTTDVFLYFTESLNTERNNQTLVTAFTNINLPTINS